MYGWSSSGELFDPIAVMLPDGSVRLYDSETDRVTARRVLAEFPDHDLFAASPSGGFEPLSPKRVLKPGGTYQIVPTNCVDLPPAHYASSYSSSGQLPMDLDAICSAMTENDFRHAEEGACDLGPSISAEFCACRDLDSSARAGELKNISSSSSFITACSSASVTSSSSSSFARSHRSIADQRCGKGFGFRRSAKAVSQDFLKAAQLQQLTGTERIN
ncbi:hypothetical protein CLOM_g5684 [Closterium sp. NIES-68]|nr:hypothetical protein CLOM_g5684 [Closterium sp. NIES-68]GJP64038.1 hypothetical protein CLOP_g21072 [Closterium sp. NIES-67]